MTTHSKRRKELEAVKGALTKAVAALEKARHAKEERDRTARLQAEKVSTTPPVHHTTHNELWSIVPLRKGCHTKAHLPCHERSEVLLVAFLCI